MDQMRAWAPDAVPGMSRLFTLPDRRGLDHCDPYWVLQRLLMDF